MIITFILTIFNWLISSMVNLLPSVSQTYIDKVSDAIDFFKPYWNTWNSYFALDSMVEVLKLILMIESAIISFKIVVFVYNKMRGSG